MRGGIGTSLAWVLVRSNGGRAGLVVGRASYGASVRRRGREAAEEMRRFSEHFFINSLRLKAS
jgi:hypothetical protein